MPVRLHNALAALVLWGGLSVLPAQAEPAIHAVVVGINAYGPPYRPLFGAVADARDIGDAFIGIGVRPVLLVDGQATRDAVLGALDRMLETARSGDTVVFTYAGHGALSDAPSDRTEGSGKDQLILLSGFSDTEAGRRQHILDDEIGRWLDRAIAKGARPLLVFDSCYSGTMFRSVDPRAGLASVRTPDFAIPDLGDLGRPSSRRQQQVPAGAFSYAAVQDNERVEEKAFSGGRRGAFSIAFAEALRGKADADHDGWLTHGELSDHLKRRTAEMMDSRQHPKLEPQSGSRSERLLRITAQRVVLASAAVAAEPPVRLRILGLEGGDAAIAVRSIAGVALARSPQEPADLVWDAAKREAVSGLGDVAATDLAPDRLGGLVEKWRALNRLQALRPGGGLTMRSLPDDRARKEGEEFGFAVEAVNGQALTILNLAGDGTVNFLYPRFADDPRRLPGDFRIDRFTRATAPFGADHVIALTTAAPPTALHALLKSYDGQPLPLAAADAVLKALAADAKGRLGIQAIVTRSK